MDEAAVATAGRLTRSAAAQATPIRLLALALAVVGAVVAIAIAYAVNQPWLGLTLNFSDQAGGAVVVAAEGPSRHIPVGTVIVEASGGGDRLRLEPKDLTGQVDGSFGPYAEYQRFMARQGRYAEMMRLPQMGFTAKDGRSFTVEPAPRRPAGSLPVAFWIGILVGAISGLIPAAIFVFRPREASARYVLLSGVSMMFCAPAGVMYAARELGLPELDFYLINGANFFFGNLASAAFFALLLVYPNRIAPRWVGPSVVSFFLVWWVIQALGLFPDLTFARRFLTLCALGGSFLLAIVHWRLTRRDPIARAALSWFLLSWVVMAGAFGFIVLAPQMFGVDTSAIEPYGFLLFLLIYGGLAIGIMRYRLFELGEWWGRIVAWTLGLILLAALDLLFLAVLQFSAGASLSLALLISGLVWLPMRGWLAERILRRPRRDDRALFQGVVQIGLSASPEDQFSRWVAVLRERFDPLNIDVAEPTELPRLDQDGLALVTPALQAIPALRLQYARGGRALFSPADLAEAGSLSEMLRFVFDSRDAYERGVTGERKRIAGDIHDNLGATLLSALHSRDGERKDRYIRETLADLRSIVTEPAGPDADLAETLAASRKEMAERLHVRGMTLDWPLDGTPPEGVDSKVAHSLRAMLRELTNNILKHAQAQTVRVRLESSSGELLVTVEDDGRGFDAAAVAKGSGLGGLQDRAARHGGTVEWAAGAAGRGTRVTIRLPRT